MDEFFSESDVFELRFSKSNLSASSNGEIGESLSWKPLSSMSISSSSLSSLKDRSHQLKFTFPPFSSELNEDCSLVKSLTSGSRDISFGKCSMFSFSTSPFACSSVKL